MDHKKRFKLYKSGKMWCCAAIAFVSLTMGTTAVGHAADQSVNTVRSATVMNQPNITNDRDSEHLAPVTNRVPHDGATKNNDVNANHGNLDGYQVQTDQQTGKTTLNVRGWQVSGRSNDQSYRYAILYDNSTHREIGRQRVTPIDRPDVQKAYLTVDNSLHAGFNVNFKLPTNISGHSVSLIARYSTDVLNGEGQHTDFWFAPIIIDNENRASLDRLVADQKGELHVSGWHATNQAMGKKYHYIIAFDQTNGREINRALVTAGQHRPDVAKAFQTIGNAANAGFDVTFKLTPQYSRHQIQFISRWTNDPKGNGQATDYWFGAVNKRNRANLDSWNLSDGTLHVSGWHANDASIFQPYHYLILVDNTTNRQVAAVKVPTTSSKDVARVYGDTRSANQARFSHTFDQHLQANHTYTLVSRYSAYDGGNGDDGVAADHTDYWFSGESLNQRAYNIDSFATNGHQLTVSGWVANDDALADHHPYLILVNNGREIGRQALTLTNRPDVAKVYPRIYNSLKSGFTTTFTVPDNVTGNFNFVFRFSNDGAHGEGRHNDEWSRYYTTNAGSFDNIHTDGRTLRVSGWHATESSLTHSHQYLFAMDNLTGREIARWEIPANQTRTTRGDVQRTYPWIANSGQSGFNISVDVPDQMTGREVRFMHRYTDDPAGNGNAVDYWDGGIFYFNPDSHSMAVNQFVTVTDPNDFYPNNRPHTMYSVYFGRDGRMVFGNQNINGQWYFFDGGSGKMESFSQRVIDWFRGRRHHLTYSMFGSRNGRDGTADCSGSMTQAIRDAGGSPNYGLYNTVTLHGYLAANGYYLAGQGTGRMQVQYGDIVIWGHQAGGSGHTVAISSFGNGDNILCISTCGYNHHQRGEAIQEYNYYRYWASDGYIYQYIYRPTNLARR